MYKVIYIKYHLFWNTQNN